MRRRTALTAPTALALALVLVLAWSGCGSADPPSHAFTQQTRPTSSYVEPPSTSPEEEEKIQEETREHTPALKHPTVHISSIPGSTFYEGPYRFVQPPLVVLEEGSHSHPVAFALYMKLNKDIPEPNRFMEVAFDGRRVDNTYAALFNDRPEHCYSAGGGISAADRRRTHYHVGMPVRVEVFIAKKYSNLQAGYLPKAERDLLRTEVPAHEELPPISDEIEAQYFRAIACKPYLEDVQK